MTSNQLVYEEPDGSKLSRKAKESPFMVAGLFGLIGICAVGAYKYRTKGQMSTSIFLMQLRVAAQGTVVSCLTLGLAYSMVQKYWLDKKQD
ncbi:HIG1 domain family member 1A, mitochondrial-like [Ctenocephalides felis]|uniref:HIG1 domain family member 1A, mitochondrial-like n=1 Tax=Ctenocephalides felis TaxID=7515 RepID=UPI000E6E19C4|nr:HIG1 domain family member 1A, mitochondrial-like [Ctenocephalides felis]